MNNYHIVYLLSLSNNSPFNIINLIEFIGILRQNGLNIVRFALKY